MKVEVVTPEDYMGDVIGDLNSAGEARSAGTEPRGNATVINAMVPLANMFGYVSQLPLDEPGAGAIHDAVRSLRAGAAGGV